MLASQMNPSGCGATAPMWPQEELPVAEDFSIRTALAQQSQLNKKDRFILRWSRVFYIVITGKIILLHVRHFLGNMYFILTHLV